MAPHPKGLIMRALVLSILLMPILVILALGAPAGAEAIRFSTDWAWQGGQAPFALAEQAGLFKAEGLEVVMDRGNGAADTVARVAGGAYDIGFGDLGPMIKLDAEQPDKALLAVLILYDRSPLCAIALARSGVRTPKDLEGKTIAAPEVDAGRVLFPALVKATGIDAAKVKWQTVAPALRETMLFKGDADAITGFITSGYFNLTGLGVKPADMVVMRYADYGIDLYGSGIYARPGFAASHPEAIKGVVRALIKAHQAALKDPAAAIAALKQRDALIDATLELQRLGMINDQLITTDATRAAGIGTVDPARLARMVATIADAYALKTSPAPEVVYTDRFLPPQAERLLPAKP
jgi:NitT/TauT family transport system substrate-binding protein